MIYLYTAIHVLCGITYYILERKYFLKKKWGWTRGDRMEAVIGIFIGPIALTTFFMMKELKNDKKANW